MVSILFVNGGFAEGLEVGRKQGNNEAVDVIASRLSGLKM